MLFNHHLMTDRSSDSPAVGVDPVATPLDCLESQTVPQNLSRTAQSAWMEDQFNAHTRINREHPMLAKSSTTLDSLGLRKSANTKAWRQDAYRSHNESDSDGSCDADDQEKRERSSRVWHGPSISDGPSESFSRLAENSRNAIHQDSRSCRRPVPSVSLPRQRVDGSIHRRGSIHSSIDFPGNHCETLDRAFVTDDESGNVCPDLLSGSYSTSSSDSTLHGYTSEAGPGNGDQSVYSDLISESGLHWDDLISGSHESDAFEVNSSLLPQLIEAEFRSHSPRRKHTASTAHSGFRKPRPSSGSSRVSGARSVRKRKRSDRSPDVVTSLAPTTENTGALLTSQRRPGHPGRDDNPSLRRQFVARAPVFKPSTAMRPGSQNVGGGRVENPTDISRCVGLKSQRASSFISHLNATTPTHTQSAIRSPQIIFISEIIPRSFSVTMRFELLHIFRTKANFIPRFIRRKEPVVNEANEARLFIDDTIRALLDAPLVQEDALDPHPIGLNGMGWPKNALAAEIFQEIGSYLSRKDLQCLRLVNHEFEKKIAGLYFRNVVIEFSSEIWGRSSNRIGMYRLMQYTGRVVAQSNSRSINIGSIQDLLFKGKGKGKGKGRADRIIQLEKITNFIH